MSGVGLTDEEKNKAIARACGWTKLPNRVASIVPNGGYCYFKHDNGTMAAHLPDYLGSLDAMHEAEKTLAQVDLCKFEHHLKRIVFKDTTDADWVEGKQSPCTHHWHATARQRATAFLASLPVHQPQPNEKKPTIPASPAT